MKNIFKNCQLSRSAVGFTLAEVLITLGIIGVVAALTIPTLIQKNSQRITISKLQKANSVLSQIYLYAQSQNGLYNFSQTPNTRETNEFFNNYWHKYLKIEKVCSSYQDCGYTKARPYIYVDNTECNWLLTYDGRIPFVTIDGVIYLLAVYTVPNEGPTYRHMIFVDVNGSKGPNKLGTDVFVFQYVAGKTVFPYGYNSTDEEVETSCKTEGWYCAEALRRNNWNVPDWYPEKL